MSWNPLPLSTDTLTLLWTHFGFSPLFWLPIPTRFKLLGVVPSLHPSLSFTTIKSSCFIFIFLNVLLSSSRSHRCRHHALSFHAHSHIAIKFHHSILNYQGIETSFHLSILLPFIVFGASWYHQFQLVSENFRPRITHQPLLTSNLYAIILFTFNNRVLWASPFIPQNLYIRILGTVYCLIASTWPCQKRIISFLVQECSPLSCYAVHKINFQVSRSLIISFLICSTSYSFKSSLSPNFLFFLYCYRQRITLQDSMRITGGYRTVGIFK